MRMRLNVDLHVERKPPKPEPSGRVEVESENRIGFRPRRRPVQTVSQPTDAPEGTE